MNEMRLLIFLVAAVGFILLAAADSWRDFCPGEETTAIVLTGENQVSTLQRVSSPWCEFAFYKGMKPKRFLPGETVILWRPAPNLKGFWGWWLDEKPERLKPVIL